MPLSWQLLTISLLALFACPAPRTRADPQNPPHLERSRPQSTLARIYPTERSIELPGVPIPIEEDRFPVYLRLMAVPEELLPAANAGFDRYRNDCGSELAFRVAPALRECERLASDPGRVVSTLEGAAAYLAAIEMAREADVNIAKLDARLFSYIASLVPPESRQRVELLHGIRERTRTIGARGRTDGCEIDLPELVLFWLLEPARAESLLNSEQFRVWCDSYASRLRSLHQVRLDAGRELLGRGNEIGATRFLGGDAMASGGPTLASMERRLVEVEEDVVDESFTQLLAAREFLVKDDWERLARVVNHAVAPRSYGGMPTIASCVAIALSSPLIDASEARGLSAYLECHRVCLEAQAMLMSKKERARAHSLALLHQLRAEGLYQIEAELERLHRQRFAEAYIAAGSLLDLLRAPVRTELQAEFEARRLELLTTCSIPLFPQFPKQQPSTTLRKRESATPTPGSATISSAP